MFAFAFNRATQEEPGGVGALGYTLSREQLPCHRASTEGVRGVGEHAFLGIEVKIVYMPGI